MPLKWRGRLTIGTVRSMPTHNIRAGIGYLLMRMANFEFQSVHSEAGMRVCLAKKFHESAAALKRAEEQAIVALSKRDEDAKYVNLAKEKSAQPARRSRNTALRNAPLPPRWAVAPSVTRLNCDACPASLD